MASNRWRAMASLLLAVMVLLLTWTYLQPIPSPERFDRAVLTFHRQGWQRAAALLDQEESLLALRRALEEAVRISGPSPDLLDLKILFIHGSAGPRVFWITPMGRVYCPVSGDYLHHRSLPDLLGPLAVQLRESFFGKPIEWREVHRLFRYDTKAQLEDLETGLRFNVFRYGGVDHADCEPLSSLDTAIMKKAYGGEWSWQRRAAVLILGEERWAASMTGMPHMGYKILDNEFDGHFCLHFQGSVIHGPRNVDDAHHVMYHKSAGLLRHIVEEPDPESFTAYLLAALGQGDAETALYMIYEPYKARELVQRTARELTGVYPTRIATVSSEENEKELSVAASLHYRDRGEIRLDFSLRLIREEERGHWKADPSFLDHMLP